MQRKIEADIYLQEIIDWVKEIVAEIERDKYESVTNDLYYYNNDLWC